MKKTLGWVVAIAGTGVLVGVAAFVSFFGWASSGRLDRGIYDAGALEISDLYSPVTAGETLRVMTYNIGYASGRSNNTGRNASEREYVSHLEAIVNAVAEVKPHVVAYQEIDYGSARSYFVDQLSVIADAVEHPYRARAYNWDKNYLPFPYWPPREHFKRTLSGQAVSSALPIRAHSKITLVKPVERPFFYNAFYLDRLAQVVTIEVGDTALTLINVHFEAYMVGTREAQAWEVIELVRQYDDGPLILLGDFNAQPPWVHEGRDDLGAPDSTMAILLAETGLSKAIAESEYGPDNMHYTFQSWDPFVALDHILYNDYVECLDARVVTEAGEGSDHLPVMMTFRVRRAEAP